MKKKYSKMDLLKEHPIVTIGGVFGSFIFCGKIMTEQSQIGDSMTKVATRGVIAVVVPFLVLCMLQALFGAKYNEEHGGTSKAQNSNDTKDYSQRKKVTEKDITFKWHPLYSFVIAWMSLGLFTTWWGNAADTLIPPEIVGTAKSLLYTLVLVVLFVLCFIGAGLVYRIVNSFMFKKTGTADLAYCIADDVLMGLRDSELPSWCRTQEYRERIAYQLYTLKANSVRTAYVSIWIDRALKALGIIGKFFAIVLAIITFGTIIQMEEDKRKIDAYYQHEAERKERVEDTRKGVEQAINDARHRLF